MSDIGRHYVTVWMRGDAASTGITIHDSDEIVEAGWFAAEEVPRPLHAFFENLICGRSMPGDPAELPDVLRRLGALVSGA